MGDNLSSATTPSPRTDEDEVANDLDLHQLIVSQTEQEPVKSADEVIKEIDDIMHEGSSSEDENSEGATGGFPKLSAIPPVMYPDSKSLISF